MNPEQRYASQIRSLTETSEYIHQVFLEKRPVDKALTAYFREHKKFGSKDRRLISSSIFGFYRWFGWLRPLIPTEIEKALLLGYLLDENEVTPLIQFWTKTVGLPESLLEGFEAKTLKTIHDKQALLKNHLLDIKSSDLNPDFVKDIPEETLDAFQTRPATYLRVAQGHKAALQAYLDEQKIEYSCDKTLPNAIAIHNRFNIHSIPLFKKGKVEIQDLTSQAVGEICSPSSDGDIWWDACAGAGGKALHLADLMGNNGKIFATDIRKSAFRELGKRVQKGDWSSITPVPWDGETMPEFNTLPNKVLVDAPCSCSGTWRRSPDIRWSITPADVVQFSELQLKILDRIAKMDLPLQTIFYATCSILKAENEDVVSKFLELHPEFKISSIKNPFSGEFLESGLHLLPPQADGIGMFIVKLSRK